MDEALREIAELEARTKRLKDNYKSHEQIKAKRTDELLLKDFWSEMGKDDKKMEEYYSWVKSKPGNNSIMYAKLKGVQLNYFEGRPIFAEPKKEVKDPERELW